MKFRARFTMDANKLGNFDEYIRRVNRLFQYRNDLPNEWGKL